MLATKARKTKMKGMSASVPMVEAVKNSRTELNSRIAEKSCEGERRPGAAFMPRSRSIRSFCTESSILRPAMSISPERASFSAISMPSASSAPMASTQSVLSDLCGITRS